MSKFFVYRNCFTGDLSGGDMHTGGVADWINRHHPEHPLVLIHAAKDGQEKAYRETADIPQIIYPDTSFRHPALMFLVRAHKANVTSLPWDPASNIFIAGSHFVPDVWPVLGQGQKAPGAKRIVYIHHIVQEMPRPKNLQTLFANLQEKFCFSLIKYHFDKIITVNQEVIDSLRQRGFRQPMLLSSNFVNMHNTSPVPFAKKDISLIFCGRLVKQKGIDDFLEVCKKLRSKLPNFRAVMVGAGPETDRLKREVADQGLNVEVIGFVPETEKFDLLARAQLFVFPSVEEGWGIVIAESLSAGTPVLAYDLPVYRQPFGKHIKTVPLGNVDRLTATAERLLASYQQDPAAYNKAQKELVAYAKVFSQDAVATKEYEFIMEDQDVKSH